MGEAERRSGGLTKPPRPPREEMLKWWPSVISLAAAELSPVALARPRPGVASSGCICWSGSSASREPRRPWFLGEGRGGVRRVNIGFWTWSGLLWQLHTSHRLCVFSRSKEFEFLIKKSLNLEFVNVSLQWWWEVNMFFMDGGDFIGRLLSNDRKREREMYRKDLILSKKD